MRIPVSIILMFFIITAVYSNIVQNKCLLAPKSLGLMLVVEYRQTLKLNLHQKLQLKLLLDMAEKVWTAPPSAVVTGLEGLLNADRILKEHNAAGIVVGSTSASLHNRLKKDEDLKKHKDIDVLVLSSPGDFTLKNPFEGGIDWFVPRDIVYSFKSQGSRAKNVSARIYVNGNNVFVRAVVKRNKFYNFKPGLYLPSRNLLIELTLAVIQSGIGPEVEIDEEVFDQFEKKMKERIGNSLSPVWRQNFGQETVLEDDMLDISAFTISEVAGIQNSTGCYDIEYQRRNPELISAGFMEAA